MMICETNDIASIYIVEAESLVDASTAKALAAFVGIEAQLAHGDGRFAVLVIIG